MEYSFKNEYELIGKRCPKCSSLVEAEVIKDLKGNFLKYREHRCSNEICDSRRS